MNKFYSFRGMAHTQKLEDGTYRKVLKMVIIERSADAAISKMVILSGLPEAVIEEQYELLPSEQNIAQQIYSSLGD